MGKLKIIKKKKTSQKESMPRYTKSMQKPRKLKQCRNESEKNKNTKRTVWKVQKYTHRYKVPYLIMVTT